MLDAEQLHLTDACFCKVKTTPSNTKHSNVDLSASAARTFKNVNVKVSWLLLRGECSSRLFFALAYAKDVWGRSFEGGCGGFLKYALQLRLQRRCFGHITKRI